MGQMTDEQLKSITDSEMRNAVGWYSGKLSAQRQKAMQYYLGRATGDLSPPEIEGRSSVVSPDVRNTVESMLPQLMTKFAGSERAVEFEATKPGDEQKAEQATDYINHLLHVKNAGERVIYGWLKDSLLSKVGVLKVWWDTRSEDKREEYRNLDQVELAQLMDDDEVEIIDQRSYPDEEDQEQRADALKQLAEQLAQAQQDPQAAQQIQAQMAQVQAQPPAMAYDVTCKRTSKGGRVCVENVPPEEFLISRKAKTIADASFVAHRVARTVSELKSMGYKNVDQIGGDDQATSLNAERIERLSFDDEMAAYADTQTSPDDSQRVIWVTECYIRVDYDGTGISSLRKVTRAGDQILDNEVVDGAPFVSICPIPMPHKFFGLSIADLAMDSQRIKTNILRGMLDNMYLSINGRSFAVDGQVNLDDLLASRPGGVVRVKQPGAVGMLDQGRGDSQLGMAMMEQMKGFLEDSTGWTRYNSGSDGDSLNQTATGVTQITNRADMRLDLIARNFAEGFRDLFRLMLKLVSQYQDKEDVIRLRGQWVAVDPREWRNGFDCTINVGLGTGNKDQLVGHLSMLAQHQQAGMAIGIATPENLYQTAAELTKAMGFKSVDKFFTDPAKAAPQPPKPGPDEIKAQAAMQLKQMDLQADSQKFQAQTQLEMQRIQMESEAKQREQQAAMQVQASNDERDAQREQLRAQMDAELKQQEAQIKAAQAAQQLEFDRWKAQLEAETKVLVAQIGAQSKEVETPAEQIAEGGVEEPDPMHSALVTALEGFTAAVSEMRRPKVIVRGADGRAVGIQ
ncbi:hypothetical protein UFOVP73_42 [uncultured Caudovirales phage]|uniref:Portal protein n=1 Tax=uncultured Caudovirales phage TaxID=2100421 RepID=A0A6J5KYN7_9CAUD|nr:hypothetical protein UFOVP73_42 [uncultured Caudovirales phage]CAB5194483.1 hypothetical protein UFOVP170_2 [uncultured Caudovirales phage]